MSLAVEEVVAVMDWGIFERIFERANLAGWSANSRIDQEWKSYLKIFTAFGTRRCPLEGAMIGTSKYRYS